MPNVHAAKGRARLSLAEQFKIALPSDRATLIDSTGRAERFEDNLVSTLSAMQVAPCANSSLSATAGSWHMAGTANGPTRTPLTPRRPWPATHSGSGSGMSPSCTSTASAASPRR
jgi:hypothetical protein